MKFLQPAYKIIRYFSRQQRELVQFEVDFAHRGAREAPGPRARREPAHVRDDLRLLRLLPLLPGALRGGPNRQRVARRARGAARHRALALDAALRGLSPDYVATLPEAAQQRIRERLGR